MAFVLLVCAEVRGEKLNLEFPFDVKPSVYELIELVERVFRYETSNSVQTTTTSSTAARKDSTIEPIFTVQKIQIYVDENRQWTDLTSPSQMHMYDQLFVVRKYLSSNDGARRELPRPRPSGYFAGGNPTTTQHRNSSQPQQQASTWTQPPVPQAAPAATPSSRHRTRESAEDAAGGVVPRGGGRAVGNTSISQALLEGSATMQEMLRVVFEAADKRRHGVLTQYDLGALFKHLSIHIEPSALEEMFIVYAQSNNASNNTPRVSRDFADNVLSFKDFSQWAAAYESTLNAAFSRIVSIEKENRLAEAQRDSATRIAELARQRQELEESLRRIEQDMSREHDRKRSLEEELDEVLQDRQEEIADDQVLVDKEVRVQHHRYLLRQEEEDFAQLAVGRRKKSGDSDSVAGAANSQQRLLLRSYSTASTPGRGGPFASR